MHSRPIPRSVAAAAFLGWRLGLGWLLGRRLLLVTTLTAGGTPRRSVVRYAFAGGNFYVPADGGLWQADLIARPTSTVQAYPGPKGVKGRPVAEGAERTEAVAVLQRERPSLAAALDPTDVVYVFAPTGERVPEMLPPDLAWAWAPLVAGALVLRRVGRRRSGQRDAAVRRASTVSA